MMKMYGVYTYLNRLIGAILLDTPNMSLFIDIRKDIPKLSLVAS